MFIQKIYKYHIIIELMPLKVLMLITQAHPENALFANIGVFKTKGLGFNQLPVKAVVMYQ